MPEPPGAPRFDPASPGGLVCWRVQAGPVRVKEGLSAGACLQIEKPVILRHSKNEPLVPQLLRPALPQPVHPQKRAGPIIDEPACPKNGSQITIKIITAITIAEKKQQSFSNESSGSPQSKQKKKSLHLTNLGLV